MSFLNYSAKDAKSELNLLKDVLSSLQNRVAALEKKINALLGKEPEKEIAPLVKPVPIKPSATIEKKEAFEFKFGKYWLNRIGIILFVLGVAFFISYTFKYLGAFAKIAIGYFSSISFFIWGRFLEKKERYRKIAWGILGGAWALLYLTTYAMHYIQVTRLISNVSVELLLLALVSFASIIYNLRYRSWVVTSITFILAFFTAGLGEIGYSTIVYCTFLTGSIAYLSYKLEWHKFLVYGIFGVYFTYFHWLYPNIYSAFLVTQAYNIPVYRFQLTFGILLINWILFTSALFLLKLKDPKIPYIVSSTLLNATFFIILGLNEIYRVRPHLYAVWDIRFWFLFVLSGLYFMYAYLYKRLNRPKLIVLNACIAFSLLAASAFIKFPRLSICFFWLIEMITIFTIGFYYKERIYRVLASILGMLIVLRLFFVDFSSTKYYTIFNIDIKHNILIFIFAALCFYFMSLLVNKKEIKNILGSVEVGFFKMFAIVGTVLLASLLTKEVNTRWLSSAWMMLGILNFTIGFYYKERIYRVLASILGMVIVLRLFFVDFLISEYYTIFGLDIKHNILIFVFVALCFYFLSAFVNKKGIKNILGGTETGFFKMFAIVGTILAASLLAKEVNTRWLSSTWAIHGIAILGAGFILRHKIYRVCGLFVLSLACLRVVFVDLADINTIYKIVAFIFLGAIFLVTSIIYSKLSIGKSE